MKVCIEMVPKISTEQSWEQNLPWLFSRIVGSKNRDRIFQCPRISNRKALSFQGWKMSKCHDQMSKLCWSASLMPSKLFITNFNNTIFWDVTSCSPVDVHQHFRGCIMKSEPSKQPDGMTRCTTPGSNIATKNRKPKTTQWNQTLGTRL
jgi:hypothetical protein